ncbi:Flp pilus assembly protein CpaB [Actinocorallia populi]|uniref:Flp pilus assembly protein CpaB n=1 Tax=Actinocorallia populi TaxID=2079200 RepID=UPI000D08AF55|nr:Flp pilus assembly protein CpaB [Actinocorallia populi]
MNRRLLSIIAALVLAGAGTLAVLAYARAADDRAAERSRPVSVLVAARAIPAGTAVSGLQNGGYLRLRNYPAGAVPDDALSRLTEEHRGLVVNTAVGEGALITRSLMEEKEASQAFAVPEGRIALTVEMGEPQRVAGYAKAGSRVVIFISLRQVKARGGAESAEQRVRILMSDVPVLAVGPASTDGTEQNPKGDRSLVTLAVTQEQAERLILGATQGTGEGEGNALYMGLQTETSELDVKSPGISNFTIVK